MTLLSTVSSIYNQARRSDYIPLYQGRTEEDQSHGSGGKALSIAAVASSRRTRSIITVIIALVFLGVVVRHYRTDDHITISEDVPVSHEVDWSRFAYTQYVTTAAYLCNSVMAFEALKRLGSQADRVMMYPQGWDPNTKSLEGRLTRLARDRYDAILIPIEVQRIEGEKGGDSKIYLDYERPNRDQLCRCIFGTDDLEQ
jgi:hypothetical protein